MLTDSIAELFSSLRAHLCTQPDAGSPKRVVIVVEEPEGLSLDQRAIRAAAGEAARGIAQALARERGPGLRINVIRCQEASADTLTPTLEFLASPAADFITGSTIDLRINP
jgi:hypothetical protein